MENAKEFYLSKRFKEMLKESYSWFREKHGEEAYEKLKGLRKDEEIEKITKKCKRITIKRKKKVI